MMGGEKYLGPRWGRAARDARRSPPPAILEERGSGVSRAIDVDAYLRRISYHGSREPSLPTLRALHLAHLHAVPLENLDVALEQRTVLDHERLFDKVVRQGRGGICHELNALFFGLLSALGFDVEMLSGRVYGRRGDLGREQEHMLLKVSLDRVWIADVGFGETFHQPLLLDERGPQKDGARAFMLRHEGRHRTLLVRKPGRTWEPQYRFNLQPRSLSDYAAACDHRLSSPGSFFSRNLICSMANPNGRVTLLNDRLIITWNGIQYERLLSGDREIRAELSKHFGIVLSDRHRLLRYRSRRAASPAT